MGRPDFIGAGQVGHRPRHFDDAMQGAGGQVQLQRRPLQQRLGGALQGAVVPDPGAGHFGVGPRGRIRLVLAGGEPGFLDGAGRRHPLPRRRRPFRPVRGQQAVVLDRRHFHKDVNPFQQRAADAPLVAGQGRRAAHAFLARMGHITAGAGVHRPHQHKAGRVGDGAGDAGDGDGFVLQGLAQGFQQGVAEFGQLVQKEDAAVAQGDFAGTEHPAAAHQPGVGDGVVGRAERALGNQRAVGGQVAADAVNLGDFQRFVGRQVGQDAGQGAGQQGFAGTGRAAEQDVVKAGGGHFQGPFGVILAADVGQVGAVRRLAVAVEIDAAVGEGRDGGFALQVRQQLGQGGYGIDAHAVHQGGFGGVHGGHIDHADALFPRHPDHRQDAGGVAQAAVQGQLAQEYGRLRGRQRLAGAEQDAGGDGQVVGRAGLFQVGGGQVDGDAAHRELAAAVAQRRPHALFGFLHGGVGQPHDVEGGQPRRNIGFGLYNLPVQPGDGASLSGGQHFILSIRCVSPRRGG